jgi:hypothetical protein
VAKTDKGFADEKLTAAGKGREPTIGKVKQPASPSESPDLFQPDFKVDPSAAARALSKAYAMTQKRLHGGK